MALRQKRKLSKLAERAKVFMTRVLVNLGSSYFIDSLLSQLLDYFENASPGMIYRLASSNADLLDMGSEERIKWEDNIRKAARMCVNLRLEKKAIEIADKVTFMEVFKILLTKAAENKLRDEGSKAYDILLFISTSPKCVRWLKNQYEKIKKWAMDVFKDEVSKYSRFGQGE